MDPIGEKLLEVAKAELGYREKSGGYTKYGDWYSKNVDRSEYFTSAAWCDMFLAWAADQAGVAEWAGQFAYTVFHAQWFKKKGAWGTDPEPGAIVFFDWSGSKSLEAIDHVGIVEKVEGNRIHTIEGNVDGVHLKRKVRTMDSIVGYGYPAKVKVEGRSVESVTSTDSKAPEKYVPKHAAPAPGIDAIGGSGTPGEAAQTVAPRDREVPQQEGQQLPGFGDLLTVVVAGSVALALGKSAIVRLPGTVPFRLPASLRLPTSSPVRVRKRGRHHRTPVALPADVSPADLEAADNATVAMPVVSAAVAAEAEDREFWGQISHLEEEVDLRFWSTIADAVSEARASSRSEEDEEVELPEAA